MLGAPTTGASGATRTPAGEDLSTREREKGVCVNWIKNRGYGFIRVGHDMVPTDEVKNATEDEDENTAPTASSKDIFIHKDSLVMHDKQLPCLRPGAQVSFILDKDDNAGKPRAEDVRARDLTPFNWYKQHGPSDRKIYPDVNTGIISEINFRLQRGYILPNQDITLGDGAVTTTTRLSFRWEDLVTVSPESKLPNTMLGCTVEFRVAKLPKSFAATQITLKGGAPFERAEEETNQTENPEEAAKKLQEAEEKMPDPDKVYKGRVLQCKLNQYGFLLADPEFHEDLTSLGNEKGQLYFNNLHINTTDVPALVMAGMRVSFKLSKETGRLAATDISTEDGHPIELRPSEKVSLENPTRQVIEPEKTFKGSVGYFDWEKSWGYLIVDGNAEDFPEEVQKGLRREGKSLYFNWKDIKSKDKVFGVNSGTRVQFKLYLDKKGAGACDIRPEDGEAFSGVVRKRAPSSRPRGPRAAPQGNNRLRSRGDGRDGRDGGGRNRTGGRSNNARRGRNMIPRGGVRGRRGAFTVDLL